MQCALFSLYLFVFMIGIGITAGMTEQSHSEIGSNTKPWIERILRHLNDEDSADIQSMDALHPKQGVRSFLGQRRYRLYEARLMERDCTAAVHVIWDAYRNNSPAIVQLLEHERFEGTWHVNVGHFFFPDYIFCLAARKLRLDTSYLAARGPIEAGANENVREPLEFERRSSRSILLRLLEQMGDRGYLPAVFAVLQLVERGEIEMTDPIRLFHLYFAAEADTKRPEIARDIAALENRLRPETITIIKALTERDCVSPLGILCRQKYSRPADVVYQIRPGN